MKSTLLQLPGRPELAMAVVLIGIITVLVVPVSRLVLDILTVISMASCLLVLLMAVRIQSPVELLTFPALLLITTMLRLSLNVASTKAILLEGRAGHVVETFGHVVMGDNLLVGLCVFAIVTVVQFLVVAKGADRVAEVSARFTLDAMPGKQMSIDAEMRAGTITPQQASARRDRLDIESRFFGGMDGAMKFVKGDAIAGLVITFVNILGGLASGMLYHGMSGSVALARFTTLSVGDAMVAQIPSFMLAVAAGLLTTRVTSASAAASDLGQQILGEIRRHPSSLIYVGSFSCLMALMPGFPVAVFLGLGLACVGSGLWIRRTDRARDLQPAGFAQPMPSFRSVSHEATPPFIVEGATPFDAPILISLHPATAAQVDPQALDTAIAQVKRRLSSRWGAPFPGLRCTIDTAAAAPGLRCTLNGNVDIPVAWHPGRRLVLGEAAPHDDGDLGIPGFPDARWHDAGDGEGAGLAQLMAGVTEHLCIREQARLLTHEQFTELLRNLRETHPQLAEGLAAAIPLPTLTDVIRALLREGISLRSLPQVCDMMLSFAPLPQDANAIADMLVTGWSRRRCAELAVDGVLLAHWVDPQVEQVLSDYAQASSAASAPAADLSAPALDADAFREVRQLFTEVARRQPRGLICLVCRGPGRLLVSEIAAMASCRFRVFSFRGVNPRFDLRIIGKIELSATSRQRLQALATQADEVRRLAHDETGEGGEPPGTDSGDDFADWSDDAYQEPARAPRAAGRVMQ